MEINWIGVVMIGMIIIVAIKIYLETDYFHLKCIISDVDGKKYCVRERRKLEMAADMLVDSGGRSPSLEAHHCLGLDVGFFI